MFCLIRKKIAAGENGEDESIVLNPRGHLTFGVKLQPTIFYPKKACAWAAPAVSTSPAPFSWPGQWGLDTRSLPSCATPARVTSPSCSTRTSCVAKTCRFLSGCSALQNPGRSPPPRRSGNGYQYLVSPQEPGLERRIISSPHGIPIYGQLVF